MGEHGLDTKLLERFLKNKFCNAKPTDISCVEVKSAVPKGDNYGSTVYRVKFAVTTASGKKSQRSLIIKTIAEWTEKAFGDVATLSSPVFQSEIKIYTTILPLMEDLMEEFGDRRNKLWTNLVGYRPYNLIAFEDLSETLYVGSPRKNCMNLEQSLLVLRSLGRFHAMSKVLLSRGLISQADKGQMVSVMDTEFINKMWCALFTVCSASMKDWGDEWEDISKKLLTCGNGITKRFVELERTYDQRFDVFNHGDLWTCNLLFQNLEFEEIPVSVKFVDFQCTHVNSFIWDVQYFLYGSTIASIRRANLELLQTEYLASLEKNLKFFDFKGYIPTLEDVKAESKRIELQCLCSVMIHPMMLSDFHLDMGKIITGPPEDVIHKSVYSDGKARESIGEDMKYLYANGVMDVTE